MCKRLLEEVLHPKLFQRAQPRHKQTPAGAGPSFTRLSAVISASMVLRFKPKEDQGVLVVLVWQYRLGREGAAVLR